MRISISSVRDGLPPESRGPAEGKYVGGSAVGHATDKEAREAVEELKKVLTSATYVSKKWEAKKDKKDK